MTPPEKFNINLFIGCKLTRKARNPKAVAPKVDKAPKTDAVKDAPKIPKAPKAKSAPKTEILTPYQIAKNAIQECGLKNREEFYDLKRKDMLPAGVPRKPETMFLNSGWNGWGEFLGTGNKQAGKTVTA
jgi:hypothetical protein